MDSRPSPKAPRPPELLLQLAADMRPSGDLQSRIQSKIHARIRSPEALTQAARLVEPDAALMQRIWSRIARSIVPVPATYWERLRASLFPSDSVQSAVWGRILNRFEPAYVRATVSAPLRWVAICAALLVLVRVSPFLFLAPTSIAQSSVTVLPQEGQTTVLISGLWQPLSQELTLKHPTSIRTQDGEATVVFFDDAVIRLAPHTTVTVNDLSDRPTHPAVQPDVVLQEGKVWVLGFIPKTLDGLVIGTSQGQVAVHEGSVSVEEGTQVAVSVWNRSASVNRRGKQTVILANQEALLGGSAPTTALQIENGRYDESWVADNLNRDAVHQREIAQMQQERRAADAGILPTEPLYPAKRLAEAVDVLFTLDPESRARKILDHANTRFNEAAALIVRGSGADAAAPLREYHDALVAVASGSGNVAVRSLVQQDATSTAAAVAAALPDDQSYALKQAVRETIAALPADGVSQSDVQGETFLDELSVVKRQAEQGDVDVAKQKLEALRGSLAPLEASGSLMAQDVRKEAEASLRSLTEAVDPAADGVLSAENKPIVLDPRAMHFQQPTVPSAPTPLTDAEVERKALEMRNRIMHLQTDQARMDQISLEFRRIDGTPDQGRLLRALLRRLPAKSFGEYVKTEMERVAKIRQEETGSGTEAVSGSGQEVR
jgi:hypothetical protein